MMCLPCFVAEVYGEYLIFVIVMVEIFFFFLSVFAGFFVGFFFFSLIF